MKMFQTGRLRVHMWAALSTIALANQIVAYSQTVNQPWPTPQPVTQLGNSSSGPTAPQADTDAYWTPLRLLSAESRDLHPQVGANGLPNAPNVAPDPTPGVRAEGALPRLGAASLREETTLIPEVFLQPKNAAGTAGVAPLAEIGTNATSSFGAYFTTYRVFPDSAVSAWPNLTAGKLFFYDPVLNKNYQCSAATFQRRLVVTAGHCVASPSTNPSLRYFYKFFKFVPAYRNGLAPVGSWNPSIVWVTNTWYFSNGSVPNAQDVGMLVMSDKSGVPIGNVTGWLGYWTNQLIKNHVTVLGYPGNLDGGERMQINHAQIFGSGGNNTYTYGSAMRGGSSGGPIIMDYGVRPGSNPLVSELARNYLVSVVSYGPISTTPKYQGASNLDSRFISLKNAACGAAGSGNCQ